MIGDETQKHKARFIPFGSKVTQAKDTKFDINFPQFLLNKTCAAYKTAPSELGFTEKVNKSSGETQENMQYRRSIKPSAKYFEGVYNEIICNQFGIPYLKFKFLNTEEQEDQLVMAQRDQIYINCGVLSPDEPRATRLGLEIDTKNPVPRLFVAGTTVMPVTDIIAQSKANIDQVEGKQNNNPDIKQSDNTNEENNDPVNIKLPNGSKFKPNTSTLPKDTAKKGVTDFFINPVGKRKSYQNFQIK
jgi:hypothetical protein